MQLNRLRGETFSNGVTGIDVRLPDEILKFLNGFGSFRFLHLFYNILKINDNTKYTLSEHFHIPIGTSEIRTRAISLLRL